MNLADYTAGTHEAQYEYESFLPATICHEWTLADAELTDLLGRADRALGELNGVSRLAPEIDFFIRMYVAKEATQSSRIEGTQTNIEDAFKDEQDVSPEERDDWVEVQNYIEASNYAIAALERLPLSNRLLCEAHARLMQGVRGERKQPGELRRSQNWIGVSLKNATFVPPHHERLADLMHDLERFLNNESHHIHPLLRAAIAHYQFETIHPFLDGNGRLGRLLVSLFLVDQKLMHKPALYLSDYFERNKTAYVDHLMAVRQANHMREWLIFFLHGIEETALAASQVFEKVLKLKSRIDTEVLPHFGPRKLTKAQAVLRLLYARPVTDIKLVSEQLEVTTNTASSLIQDLVRHGVLKEVTGQQRNRLFVFSDYVTLFQ